MREQRTFCRFCIAYCGAVVTTDDEGQVLSVRGDERHPSSRGYLCPKGRALGINHHDPRRVSEPQMGRGAERRRVTWDELLDDAASRLADVIEEHGPSSVAFLVGNGGSFDASGRWALERLQARIGSRTRYTNMTVDTPAKPVIGALMAGSPVLVPAIDHQRASMIVLVGCNPVVSHGHMNSFPDPVRRIRELADRGEVWVVDPRRSETAELATHHLAIRPDTDWALLAHAVRELLRTGADHDYMAQHATQAQELAAAVAPFTADRTSDITGLSVGELTSFVESIRRHGRIAAQTGTGSTFTPSSTVVEWLIWSLSVITGSYDQEGGMWFHPGFFKQLDQRDLPQVDSPYEFRPGPQSRPDLPNITGETPGAAFADEVAAGNVRAAVIAGLNPLTAYPDHQRQVEAMEQLEVAVVADVMSSELTDLATHVMPVSGPLERADLNYWADFLMMDVSGNYTPRVVEPDADRRPQWQALAQLGARLGVDVIAEGVDPDSVDEEEIIDRVGRGARMAIGDLRSADTAVVADEAVFGWVHDKVLPEGGWRLAPPALVDALAELEHGAAPAEARPLSLISVRQSRHVNFQLTGVALGGGHRDEAHLLMAPDDANDLELTTGAAVRVTSAAGELTTSVRVTDTMLQGTVALPQGFEDVNVTSLVDSDDVDPHSGMPRQTAIDVRVEAV